MEDKKLHAIELLDNDAIEECLEYLRTEITINEDIDRLKSLSNDLIDKPIGYSETKWKKALRTFINDVFNNSTPKNSNDKVKAVEQNKAEDISFILENQSKLKINWYRKPKIDEIFETLLNKKAISDYVYYTPEELNYLKNKIKNYIPTKFARHYDNDEYNEGDIDLIAEILKRITNSDGHRFYIGGESGVGKTTLLFKLFFELVLLKHKVIILPMHKQFDAIFDLPLHIQNETILLLDSFEDCQIANENKKLFFEHFYANTAKFKQVICTFRTNYFTDINELDNCLKSNDKRYYIKLFNLADCKQFIIGKTPKNDQERVLKLVKEIYAKYDEFTPKENKRLRFSLYKSFIQRPFILENLSFLSTRKFGNFEILKSGYIFLIYKNIIDSWITNEYNNKLFNKKNDQNQFFYDLIINASLKLSLKLFKNNADYFKFVELRNEFNDDIEYIQIHSLLIRYENSFRFAHKNFYEYFLALNVFSGNITEKELYTDYNRKHIPHAIFLYEEMLWAFVANSLDADEIFELNNYKTKSEQPKFFKLLQYAFVNAIFQHEKVKNYETINAGFYLDVNISCTLVLYKQLLELFTNSEEQIGVYISVAELMYAKKQNFLAFSEIEPFLIHSVSLKDSDNEAIHVLTDNLLIEINNGYAFRHYSWYHFFLLQPYFENHDLVFKAELYEVLKNTIFADAVNWLMHFYPFLKSLKNLSIDEKLDSYKINRNDYFEFSKWFTIDISNNELISLDTLKYMPKYNHLVYINASSNLLSNYLGIEFCENLAFDLSNNNFEKLPAPEVLENHWLFTLHENPIEKRNLKPHQIPDKVVLSSNPILRNETEKQFAQVYSGTFYMGSEFKIPENELTELNLKYTNILSGQTIKNSRFKDEQPVHKVFVSDFAIRKNPVTIHDFVQFVKNTGYLTYAQKEGYAYCVSPKTYGGPLDGVNYKSNVWGELHELSEYNHPVKYVSWFDAFAYCFWLSKTTGLKIALPTEAQWEYAAIGGHFSPIDEFGIHFSETMYSGTDNFEDIWHIETSGEKPQGIWHAGNMLGNRNSCKPVGLKPSNKLGIYDMSGNVYEWCADWYGSYPNDDEVANAPAGALTGSSRVMRGGSWGGPLFYCRVANRNDDAPGYRDYFIGFRPVLVP